MGMQLVERNKFFGGLILAGIVVVSIILLRGADEYSASMNAEPNMDMKKAGQALFVIGWVGMGYYLSLGTEGLAIENQQKLLWIMGPILLIIVSIMMMEGQGVTGDKKKGMEALFIVGSASLALAVTMGKSTEVKIIAFLGAALIGGSKYMLDYQKQTCTVHGPGMPMLVGGLIALVFSGARAW